MGVSVSDKILVAIDEKIQRIVSEVNKLAFVRKTHFSCQGHSDKGTAAFMDIEFEKDPIYDQVITSFKLSLKGISGFASQFPELLRDDIYHYACDWRTEAQVTDGWADFMRIVIRYKNIKF